MFSSKREPTVSELQESIMRLMAEIAATYVLTTLFFTFWIWLDTDFGIAFSLIGGVGIATVIFILSAVAASIIARDNEEKIS